MHKDYEEGKISVLIPNGLLLMVLAHVGMVYEAYR